MESIESFLANRTAKDSVFTRLFSDPYYMYELYQSLYPEDRETTVRDLEDVTIQNALVITIYNDLAFIVKNRLIVFVEDACETDVLIDYIALASVPNHVHRHIDAAWNSLEMRVRQR